MTHRRRLRQRLLIIFLIAMTIPYARQIVTSPTVGQDFRAFFAAATVIAQHGDPYDWPSLARAEYQLYDAPQQLKPGDPGFYEFLAYPEGPWLAFGLVPLTGLPWQAADAIYAALLFLVLLGASMLVFSTLGWRPSRAWLCSACVALSAIGFINLFMGQVSVMVFGGFIGAWWLARRGHGWWAGLVLACIWLKPNIGLPIPLVVALLEPAMARRVIAGFIGASAVIFGAAFAALGTGFFEWPLQVPRMWQAVQGLQPDIASIESFFYPGLSGLPKTVALLLSLTAAAAYAVWALRRAPDARTRGLTLLLVWLAALPFVQSYDMILLLPLLAVLLGPELTGWGEPTNELTVWAFLIFPLCYFLGFRLGYFNGFTAIPVALLALAWHRRLIQQPRADRIAVRVAA
jgi:hypothetical protein